MDCQYIESESSDAALLTVAYVMAAVCALCLLPITVLLIQASFKRRASLTEAGPLTSQQILTDTSQGEGYGVHTRKNHLQARVYIPIATDNSRCFNV